MSQAHRIRMIRRLSRMIILPIPITDLHLYTFVNVLIFAFFLFIFTIYYQILRGNSPVKLQFPCQRAEGIRNGKVPVLAVIFAVLCLLSAYRPSAAEVPGDGTEWNPYQVSTWSDLYDKMSMSASGTKYIKLIGDVTYGTSGGDHQDSAPLTVSGTVVLDLYGATIDRNLYNPEDDGYVIYVNNAHLTLNDSSGNKGGRVTGGYNSSMNGGGIRVEQSTFTMNGGTIIGNKIKNTDKGGGGVFVDGGSAFNMAGGVIGGNHAEEKSKGGGVYLEGACTFTMTGGEIIYNTTESNGGGIYAIGAGPGQHATINLNGGKIGGNQAINGSGGGIFLDNYVTVNMSGGTIGKGIIFGHEFPNTAQNGGGVYVRSSCIFNMTGGTIGGSGSNENIAAEYGGGVYIAGEATEGTTFNMSGGTIGGTGTNYANSAVRGGGVYVTQSTNCKGSFNLSGSASVQKNTAKYGGGVFVDKGSFSMSGGTVKENQAVEDIYVANGGGVYLSSGTCTISGSASITANTAFTRGAGMYLSGGTCSISGSASITANTANTLGGGVYKAGGILKIEGAPTISGNIKNGGSDNVYLPDGQYISVSDAMTNSTAIGITMKTPGVFTNSSDTTKNDKTKFGAENSGYSIVKNAAGQLEMNNGSVQMVYYATGSGGSASYTDPTSYSPGTNVAVKSPGDCGFSSDGYTFKEWNTVASPSTGNPGLSFSPGASFPISSKYHTLYGQWDVLPAAAPTITTQPAALTLTYGYAENEGSISVAASPATDAAYELIYQWYKCEDTACTNKTTVGTNIGSYPITTGLNAETYYYYCEVKAKRTDNDQVSSPVSSNVVSVTVEPKTINPSIVTSGESFTYNGSAQTFTTVTVKDGETVISPESGEYSISYSDNINAGTDTAQLIITDAKTGTATGNYTWSEPAVLSFTIGQATLTVTVEEESKTYGDADPALTYTAEGFQGSDTAAIMTGALSRAEGENAGTYAITQGTLSAGANYTISYEGANLTINPKAVTPKVTTSGETFTYDGSEKVFSSVTLWDGETEIDSSEYTLTYDNNVSAGENTAKLTVSDAKTAEGNTGNYTLTTVDLLFSIAQPSPESYSGPDFFRILDGFELPATGFSSGHGTVLPEQPKELSYKPTLMSLQIPALNVETELVTIPLNGNTWPVEWLRKRAGLLEGSALPGEGVAVIAGHNTLNDMEYGPFAAIALIQPGDHIFVSGKKGLLIYEVYANRTIGSRDTDALARTAGMFDNTLTLLTCEDERPEGGYASRRIISARLIGN